jgi:hypothetical protein
VIFGFIGLISFCCFLADMLQYNETCWQKCRTWNTTLSWILSTIYQSHSYICFKDFNEH